MIVTVFWGRKWSTMLQVKSWYCCTMSVEVVEECRKDQSSLTRVSPRAEREESGMGLTVFKVFP